MRQLLLPYYQPLFPSPERAVLTVLHAALCVAEHTLRDEHPLVDAPLPGTQHHASLVIATARLIVGRCAELRILLDAYDQAVDELLAHDDSVSF
jgi:hypothetical protein